jgi:probable O-glycosylation ligase (exosortase A-associated)
MRAALLLILFVCSLPVCFVRPFYGILMWTIVAFLNPQSYVWGRNAFPWALAVAVSTIAGLIVFDRNWLPRLISREVALICLLWLWFTTTTLISTASPEFLHHATETWLKWELVSKILLMTLVTMAVVRTAGQLRILMLVICGCFGLFLLKSLPFVIATGGQDRLYGPSESMIADNNDFGLALVMTLPMYFFLAQAESRLWIKRGLGFLGVISVPAIFFTYSRGALVGLVAVLLFMLWRSRHRLLLVPVIIVGIVAFTFAPNAWHERMSFTTGKVLDLSAQSRLNAWTFCWRLALEHPVTGGGFATFTRSLFARYSPNAVDVHNSHSIYFGVLAEHGFPGLLLFCLLIASCFLTARRVILEARAIDDDVAILYARMLCCSIMGFLVCGAFLSRAYFDYYFALVAAVVILRRVCESDWAAMEGAGMQGEETSEDAGEVGMIRPEMS